MKKTLVAIAAAAAVTGAMADVTISGQINDAMMTDKFTADSTGTGASVKGMHSMTGDAFITFSGNEDLGNGLTAKFKVEQTLNLNGFNAGAAPSIGANSVFSANAQGNNNREAWVGVSGDFGSVSIGNQYSPMFLAAIAADPLGANNVTGAMGNFGLSAVLGSNSIVYSSPSFSGFTLSVMQNYGANETTATAQNAGDSSAYSLTYASGPLALAYGRHEAKTAAAAAGTLKDISTGQLLSTYATNTSAVASTASLDGDTITGQGLSASYDLGAAKVGYWGSKVDYSNGDRVQGQSGAISAPFGNIVVAYTFGSGSATPNAGTTVNFTGYQYSVQYNFSKRTNFYVTGGNTKDTTNDQTRDSSGFGLHHSF